jgi:N-acetylmuramic acid 6-phosphate (MurNAc-6-P) etherase
MRRAIPFLLVGQAGVSGQFYMGKNDRGRMSIARKKDIPPTFATSIELSVSLIDPSSTARRPR